MNLTSHDEVEKQYNKHPVGFEAELISQLGISKVGQTGLVFGL